MLFNGKLGPLGSLLGLDIQNVPVLGSRGTPYQGGIWHKKDGSGGVIGVGPSWRFVTDMKTQAGFSALPGGNSGNVFSQFFSSRLASFFEGRYDEREFS